MNVPEVEQLDGVWVPDGCVGGLTVAVILTEWAHEQHNLSKNWERTFKKKLPAFYGRKKPNAVVQIYAHLWGELVCCNISLLCHNCSFSLGGVAHRQHNKMLTCSMPQLHTPQRNGSFDLKCILNQVFSWLAGQVYRRILSDGIRMTCLIPSNRVITMGCTAELYPLIGFHCHVFWICKQHSGCGSE